MKNASLPSLILFSAIAAEMNKTKKSDLLKIDPRNIFIPKHGEGFHYRSVSNYGSEVEFEEFMGNIRANGVVVPLEVKKVKPSSENNNCEFELVYGFRRMEAVTRLLAEGAELPYVPAILSTGSDEDRLFRLFAQDTSQVHLNVIEQAEVVKALIAKGYDAKDMPARIGKSLAYVYNLISLSKLPKKVKDQVTTGKISTNAVLTIMRKETNTEKVGARINEAIKNAQSHSDGVNTEKRATAANVNLTTANDKKAPFEKLKAVYRLLDAEGVKNDKMLILELLLTKATSATVDQLAEIIRGGKAPKNAIPAAATNVSSKAATVKATTKKGAVKAKASMTKKTTQADKK